MKIVFLTYAFPYGPAKAVRCTTSFLQPSTLTELDFVNRSKKINLTSISVVELANRFLAATNDSQFNPHNIGLPSLSLDPEDIYHRLINIDTAPFPQDAIPRLQDTFFEEAVQMLEEVQRLEKLYQLV